MGRGRTKMTNLNYEDMTEIAEQRENENSFFNFENWSSVNESNVMCRLAATSTSISKLKELATAEFPIVRAFVKRNLHSSEEVLLLLYAYEKFGKLTK
jgi:hypothetical protein